jgi:hypothetical protein
MISQILYFSLENGSFVTLKSTFGIDSLSGLAADEGAAASDGEAGAAEGVPEAGAAEGVTAADGDGDVVPPALQANRVAVMSRARISARNFFIFYSPYLSSL